MIVHEVFAQISDGEVKNIMVYDNYPTADYFTKCIYGSEAFAVDCLQFGCSIGDKYHDGCFWKINPDTGEESRVDYIPTQEQEVESLKFERDQMMLAIAELIGGGTYAE